MDSQLFEPEEKLQLKRSTLLKRRLLILLFCLSVFVLGPTLGWLTWGARGTTPIGHLLGTSIEQIAGIVMIILTLGIPTLCSTLLQKLTRKIAVTAPHHLNDRDRAIRAKAYAIAFRIISACFILGILLILTNIYGQILPDSLLKDTARLAISFLYPLTMLVVSLPTLVIAWTEKDV